jgi:hypothetical protein
MPRIHQYEATVAQTKVNPPEAGYSAEEMAGRRIGPFYEQIARGEEGLGRLENERIEGEKGLLEFARLALYKPQGTTAFKYGGGLKNGEQLEAGGRSPNIAALNYMSQAAPIVSQVAKQLVTQATPQQQDLSSGGHVDYTGKNSPAVQQQNITNDVNNSPFLPQDKQQQYQTDTSFSPNPNTGNGPSGMGYGTGTQQDPNNPGQQLQYDANGNPLTNPGTQGTTNPAPTPAAQQAPSVWDEIGQGQAAGAGGTS